MQCLKVDLILSYKNYCEEIWGKIRELENGLKLADVEG